MTEDVTAQNDLCVSQKGISSLDFYLAPKYKDSKGSQKFYFHVYKKSDSHMELGFPWAGTWRWHNLIQFRHHYWRPSTPRNIWAIKIDIIKKKKKNNKCLSVLPNLLKKRKVTDTMVLYEWLFPTLQQNQETAFRSLSIVKASSSPAARRSQIAWPQACCHCFLSNCWNFGGCMF